VSCSTFVRAPDHLYAIEGNSADLYWAGFTANGDQVFVTVLLPHFLVTSFGRDGDLIRAEVRMLHPNTLTRAEQSGIRDVLGAEDDLAMSTYLKSIGFRDGVIRVKRFFLSAYCVGIVDFAKHLEQILEDPTKYDADERAVAHQALVSWQRDGIFELW